MITVDDRLVMSSRLCESVTSSISARSAVALGPPALTMIVVKFGLRVLYTSCLFYRQQDSGDIRIMSRMYRVELGVSDRRLHISVTTARLIQ